MNIEVPEFLLEMSKQMNKITLTKELPTEEGRYYWTQKEINGYEVLIVEVFHLYGELRTDMGQKRALAVRLSGGFWAKVDDVLFEIKEPEE